MTGPVFLHNEYAIDTHVHLWSNDYSKYPLAQGFTPSQMALAKFEAADILAEAKQNGVGKAVLVQMSYYGSDNKFLLETIARDPLQFRGIAVIDEYQAHPEEVMHSLSRLGICGFRVTLLDPSKALQERRGLKQMFEYAAGRKFAMCLLLNPDAIGEAAILCRNFPDTPVVIDHMARIGMSGPIEMQHVEALCELAQFPQVTIKLSAFYALSSNHLYGDLSFLIRALYKVFGPTRLMWGSDSPFEVIHGAYSRSISLIRDRLEFLSDVDRHYILKATAEELFFRTIV